MTTYEVWDTDTGNMLLATEDEREMAAAVERLRAVSDDIVVLQEPED